MTIICIVVSGILAGRHWGWDVGIVVACAMYALAPWAPPRDILR